MPFDMTSDATPVLYRESPDVPSLQDPVRVAIIGAGARSTNVYLPLLEYLRPWVRVVAVCDPIPEHADRWAEVSGTQAFYNIHDLVRSRPMEAAIVVTPIESHHSISVFLSSNGIHNHVETAWASLFCQAKEMCAAASRQNVVTRMAENFFRTPYDRFAQTIARSGYLGPIGRIVCYNDQTGYHCNARWVAFAGERPRWVQAVEHELPHDPFYSQAHRRHDTETLRSRFYQFSDLAILDVGCGHGKGLMGRQARPGHTEWHGSRGTLSLLTAGAGWAQDIRFEVRHMSDRQFASGLQEGQDVTPGGQADEISPVQIAGRVDHGVSIWSDTPEGRIERAIPFCPGHVGRPNVPNIHGGLPVMDHTIDFALAVRGARPSEFTDQDALDSEMMEAAACESSLQSGRRVCLPLEGDLEVDAVKRDLLRTRFGVDPMDVDAMLNISYPTP